MSEPVLSVKELETHLYSREGTIKPVNSVSFDIRQGETLGIVGESGSGKTMTALSIMGLIPKNLGGVVGGSVVLDGEDLAKMSDTEVRRRRSTKMGMIFQDPATSLNPTMKVGPADSRDDEDSPRHQRHHGAQQGDRAARPRGHPVAGEPLQQLSVPVQRRHEAAGDDRHRPLLRSPTPHRGRADDGTRRDDSGAAAGLRQGDQRGTRHVGHVDHARPGRGSRTLRSGRSDVRRFDCRDGVGGRHLRAAQAPVYIDAAQLHALDRGKDGWTTDVD